MKEALPVWGSLEQWSPRPPALHQHEALQRRPAASQGQRVQEEATAYHGISQADAVSARDAVRFLVQEEATWNAKPHPRGRFRADITSRTSASPQGHFNWPYYIQWRAWFQEHFEGVSVARFQMAWSNRLRHPVFVGQRSDGWSFTVNPNARSQAHEFSWGCDDISES